MDEDPESRRLTLSARLIVLIGWGFVGLSPLRAQSEPAPPPQSSPGDGVVVSRTMRRDRLEVRAAIERGLAYLEKRQQKGAIGSRYKVAVTSLAGLAVLGAGYQPRQGPYDRLLAGCVGYLKSIEQDGYMTERDAASRMHGHCYAVLFLTQVIGTLPPEEEAEVAGLIRRGVRVIERAQSTNGGWYYDRDNVHDKDEASVTVCALQALRAARNVGFPIDAFRVKQALRYVKECQGQDGSFAYSLEERGRRTYALSVAALSTLNAAGVYRSEELQRGLDYVRRRLADHPRSPWRAAEVEYPFYANLYAAEALYQDGGDLWQSWYPAVSKYLLSKQRTADGATASNYGSWESNFGDEYGTAFAILILEVPLGYLPIFQR